MRKHGGKGGHRQANSPWFAKQKKVRDRRNKAAKQSRKKNRRK